MRCRQVLRREAEQGNLDPHYVQAFCDLMPVPVWTNAGSSRSREIKSIKLASAEIAAASS